MNRLFRIAAVLLLSIVLLAPALSYAPVSAAIYYTDTYVNASTGSDDYNGSSPVYTGYGNGPVKSIGYAIGNTATNGTVHVAAGTYTEIVHLTENMNLVGQSALNTVINANRLGCAVQLTSAPSHTNTIAGFTIRGGGSYNGNPGGGVYVSSSHIVTINDCIIIDNIKGTGLVQEAHNGAGICNDNGQVYLNRCTISGNTADNVGGGIANIADAPNTSFGKMWLTNCTISGNTAVEAGGGIYNNENADMTLLNVTIAGNQCTAGKSEGGGFANAAANSMYFKNCLVANNTAGYSQFGNGFGDPASTISQGNNLDSQNSCHFSLASDQVNTNPLLGALQNNGGPTSTMAITPESPAYNRGNRSGAPPTDQRGVSRAGSCSIGAYEPMGGRDAAANTTLGTVNFSVNTGAITNMAWSAPADLRCSNPSGYYLPYGMFSYNISELAAGASVRVTVRFPNPIPLGTKYFKCINGVIVDCSAFTTRIDEYTLQLTLTDGGQGDADGIANGVIVDPGGPAFPVNVPQSSSAQMPVTAPQKPISLSNITVKSASLSASKVTPGTPVTVTASIANTGTGNGASVINLFVNGEQEAQQGVTVNSGGTSQVSFNISRSEPGTYTVYVGGTSAGSFTVDQFTPDTILYISGSMVFFAFILGIIWMTRKRA